MPTTRPVQAQPDPDRVVPHLAIRALVALHAVDACLDAIDGPHREGALRALRSMHESEGRRGAHQEAGHGPFARGAPRDPGDDGAPLSSRGRL